MYCQGVSFTHRALGRKSHNGERIRDDRVCVDRIYVLTGCVLIGYIGYMYCQGVSFTHRALGGESHNGERIRDGGGGQRLRVERQQISFLS